MAFFCDCGAARAPGLLCCRLIRSDPSSSASAPLCSSSDHDQAEGSEDASSMQQRDPSTDDVPEEAASSPADASSTPSDPSGSARQATPRDAAVITPDAVDGMATLSSRPTPAQKAVETHGDAAVITPEDVFGEDFVSTHFNGPSDLTEALCNAMPHVLESDIMPLLPPAVAASVRVGADSDLYQAAEQIVKLAVTSGRRDLQRQVLTFVRRRKRLYRYLRSPPQKVLWELACDEASPRLRQLLREELKPADVPPHSDVLTGCLDGTRNQVLDDIDEAVQDAIRVGGKQVIWLSGVVGAGKTSVMSSMAKRLAASYQIATFYCSRASTAQSDPHRVLSTVGYYLGFANADIGIALLDVVRRRTIHAMTPAEQLRFLILDPLDEALMGPTVILIDALDECGSGDGLRQLLSAIVQKSDHVSSVVILVAGRPERDLSAKLDGSFSTLRLGDKKYESTALDDVHRYIDHRLSTDDRFLRNVLPMVQPTILYDTVVYKLSELAHGYFVVASFICSAIVEGIGGTDFLSKTLSLVRVAPEAKLLYKTFATALGAIFAHSAWEHLGQQSDAKLILATLSCALEPLSTVVIASLCGLSGSFVQDALEAFGPLLVASPDRHEFFHASVADFLESEDAVDYRVSAPDHHGQLFLSCCRILQSQLDFNIFRIVNSSTTLDQLEDQAVSPELAYASVFWTHHLVASSLCPEVAASKVATLLQSKFLFWVEVLSGLRRVYPDGVRGLNEVTMFLGASGGSIVSDCQQCLEQWAGETSRHPCRIYLTVLPWLPSFFREQLSNHGPWILSLSPQVRVGAPSRWGDTPHAGAPDSEPPKGHTDIVWSIAFSPDGVRLASGSADNTVRLWDATSGALCGGLEGLSDGVYAVAFSSDGSTIASGSDDGTVRLWDAHSGAARGTALEGHTGPVTSVVFSLDGARVASASGDKTVRLWDASSGAPCGVPFKGHTKWVYSVAFSPDGSKIASGSLDMTVRLWDAVAGVPFGDPLEGHAAPIWSIAFSPDGLTLASGSDDTTVRLWSVEAGVPRCEPLEGHTHWVKSVAFSDDGNLLFSVSWDEMLVWDLSGWVPTLRDTEPLPVRPSTHLTPKTTLALPTGYEAMAFSPASQTLAGRYGPDECQVFALQLPSYDPWKALCDAHAESRRATTELA